MKQEDVIIVGAGFAGAVAARQFADMGKNVLVIERRNHIGGNAYDFYNQDSILVHRYGPHIFHTDNDKVFNYLSRFTRWRGYKHKVGANISGNIMPVPFNFKALEKAFAFQAEQLKEKLLFEFDNRKKITIHELRQSNDSDLKKIGDYIYNNYFDYYSRKQWGEHFKELDPATFERVPVVLSYDDHYFQDKWQGVPEEGYTKMFENILTHSNIDIKLGTDSKDLITLKNGNIFYKGKLFSGKVIYTGSIDELFDYKFGDLPYRTLDFKFETHQDKYYQEYAVVNYTVDQPYTRITEYKHLTGQKLDSHTTIAKEYPGEFSKENGDIPYYPIPADKSRDLYKKYLQIANRYSSLYLLGRLAEYKYYDMDIVVENALKLSKNVKG